MARKFIPRPGVKPSEKNNLNVAVTFDVLEPDDTPTIDVRTGNPLVLELIANDAAALDDFLRTEDANIDGRNALVAVRDATLATLTALAKDALPFPVTEIPQADKELAAAKTAYADAQAAAVRELTRVESLGYDKDTDQKYLDAKAAADTAYKALLALETNP